MNDSHKTSGLFPYSEPRVTLFNFYFLIFNFRANRFARTAARK